MDSPWMDLVTVTSTDIKGVSVHGWSKDMPGITGNSIGCYPQWLVIL